MGPSPFLSFETEEWSALRASTPLTLTEADLETLRGINEHISLDEVAMVYLPLSRLLSLYVQATQQLYSATDTFLGHHQAKVPYVIGIAGSVAVGKHLGELCARTGLLAGDCAAALVDLELRERCTRLAGGRYIVHPPLS